MSIAALNWAWQQPCPSAGLQCTLIALADHADESGECWPGIERLARRTSATRRTVIRWLGELTRLGLVEKAPRQRQDGGQTTNRYRLQLQACQPPTPPTTSVEHALPSPGSSVVAPPDPDEPSRYGSRPEQQESTNAASGSLPPTRTSIPEEALLPQGECHPDTGGCHLAGDATQVIPGGCHLDTGGCQPDLGGVTTKHGGDDTVARGECQADTPMNHHDNPPPETLRITPTTTTPAPAATETSPPAAAGGGERDDDSGSGDGDRTAGKNPDSPPQPTACKPDLILPPALSTEQVRVAQKALQAIPSQAQALLDELAGQMINKQATGQSLNPLSYLNGLITRARVGTFEPTAGIAVRQAREQARQRARHLEAVQRRNEAAALAALEAVSRDLVGDLGVRGRSAPQGVDKAPAGCIHDPVPAPKPESEPTPTPGPRLNPWRREIQTLRDILKRPSRATVAPGRENEHDLPQS